MSIVFFEGRRLPSEVRNHFSMNGVGRMGVLRLGDGDFGTQVSQIVQAASPWDLLKGVFVDKPAAQARAQQAVAEAQAAEAGQYQMSQAAIAAEQQATLRTGLMIGAGLLGVVAVISLMRRPAKAVGGYSRRKRSRK